MVAHNKTVISVEGNTIRQLQEKALPSTRGQNETTRPASVNTAKKKLQNVGQSGRAAAAEIDDNSGATGPRDRSHMAAIGRKGGQVVSQDRAHMAAIGRKGGQAVSRDRAHMAMIGRKGGQVVSQDRAHMAKIGRKGGATVSHAREPMANPEGSQGDEGEKQRRTRRAKHEIERYDIAGLREKPPSPAGTKPLTIVDKPTT